jgi:hypothetical protein
VAARRAGDSYEYQSQLNAFVQVPLSRMTEKALSREGVPFTRINGDLVVHGNESVRFADLLGLESRRPMTAGLLNPTEPHNTEVIRNIVETVIGEADGDGTLLYFSVPAPPLDGGADLTYHEATLDEMVAARGYEVKSIDEGLAVVYGELERSNYTGIGISCGGGLCNVCLAYLAVPIARFSVPKAGDYIDAHAASATGDRATRTRAEKESSFQFNGAFQNKVHQALGVYYDDMIQTLISSMQKAFGGVRDLPNFKQPIPMVLSGGTSLPRGFADRFTKALRAGDFPVPLSGISLATDPLYSTAKGALAAALTDI